MSTTTKFLQHHAAQLDTERQAATARLARQQENLRGEFQQHMDRLDKNNEQFLTFAQPILAHLSQLPEGVDIVGLKKNVYLGEVELTLKGAPSMSLANMLLEYPALAVVRGADGQLREASGTTQEEPVYTGVFVDAHKPQVHWDAHIGGELVRVVCQMEHVNVAPWKNPVTTGAPVADVQVGSFGDGPWIQVGSHHHNYWIQPANGAAKASLDGALQWKQDENLARELKTGFEARLNSIEGASFGGAQGRIVANALFAWARSSEQLPTAQDFLTWPPVQGNVLVMRTKNDWEKLLTDESTYETVKAGAQKKMELLAEKLPNIWRFVSAQGVDKICAAMAEVQTRSQASQPTLDAVQM